MVAFNVLVTGGSRGIGRAAARLAGARGWNVGINYLRNAEAARNAQEEAQKAGGGAVCLQGDISKEKDMCHVFDSMERQYGSIHGVVINGGIVAPSMPLAEMSLDRLRHMFETNILGAYLCAREAARRLPPSRGGQGGSIVLVSSAASRIGSPNEYVDYAGSKGAVDTLTLGLAKELGPLGIRVNAVRPGLINTEIHIASGDPGRAERLGKKVPLGRAGEADEVAEAIVWLLSPASSYVTGSFLDVSGGR